MRKSAILVMALALCVPLARCTGAESGDVSTAQEDDVVKLILTKLSVDEQNFEMGWTIVNNTDHDVWFCDSATDWFMDTDNETLVIRRRYNIPRGGVIWEIPFPRFRYSRLGPGEQKVKSITRALPVEPYFHLKVPQGNAEHARRVALEIGYYDEDLRALILEIVNVRDKLGCDWSAFPFPTPQSTEEVLNRFFGGVGIARQFDSLSYFRDSVTSGGDEIIAPYFDQALHGELVLRLEVDNVSIPYRSNDPPLASQAAKSDKNLQNKKTDTTKLAKADSKKPLKQEDSGTGK